MLNLTKSPSLHIYIDESGSFANTTAPGAWNCVAAYVSPEQDRCKVEQFLADLKTTVRNPKHAREIKLGELDETEYFSFLLRLSSLSGIVFCVCSDAASQSNQEIARHQEVQCQKVEEHKDKMLYPEGREGLVFFAEELRKVAPQLYVQLYHHIYLIFQVVNYGSLFFVQRIPKTLREFRWRIDQKNESKNVFQDAYLKLSLPILQTMSMRWPFPQLEGADYSSFERYDFAPEEKPTYLKDTYGIEVRDGFNLGKLIREDMKFEDSKNNLGIQVADLIASGIRRCLRGNFSDNDRAASLLGRLTIRGLEDHPAIRLIGFGTEESQAVDSTADRMVTIMRRMSKPMLVPET